MSENDKTTLDGAETDRQQATISIVEASDAVRETLRATIASRGYRCELYASAEAFLASTLPDRPGCLVLDYQLPGISGLELQDRLTRQREALPIIVTTGQADVPAAVRFMERCGITLLEKPYRPEHLFEVIDRAIEVDTVQRRVNERFNQIRASVDQLSQREKTVLQAIVGGQLNKAIARTLDVSVRTIEGDRAKIVEKFEAETTGEVVGKYAQYSLLSELGFSAR